MNKNITTIIVLFVGLALAIVLGTALPTAQIEVIAFTLGSLFFVLCIALKGKIWMLIPCSMMMSGSLTILPGNPQAWQIMILAAAFFYVLRYMVGLRELQFKLCWFDGIILLQVFAIGQSFLRNPVGLSLLGSEVIGSKPYYYYAIATIGYLVLRMVKITMKDFKFVVIVMVVVGLADASIATISGLLPSLGYAFARFYNQGVVSLQASNDAVAEFQANDSRFSFLFRFGRIGSLICATMWRPISNLNPLHPFRLVLCMVSFAAILLSGFRSKLAEVGFWMITGTIARKNYGDVIVGGFVGLAVLSILLATSLPTHLPFAAQRAISIIPGIQVSSAASNNASDTVEWRVEMWELALTGDRYIKNKWLGDGFGMSAVEHQFALDRKLGFEKASHEDRLEYFMAKGSYHSFPVEVIRFTGVLGLLLATVALFFFARKAWALISYYRARDGFSYVLFVTIPFLAYPLFYWLVFGTYKGSAGFVFIILQAGLLKMLDNIRQNSDEMNQTLEVSSQGGSKQN